MTSDQIRAEIHKQLTLANMYRLRGYPWGSHADGCIKRIKELDKELQEAMRG